MKSLRILVVAIIALGFAMGCSGQGSIAPALSALEVQKSLQENPLAPADNFKMATLHADKYHSCHIAQIRDKEVLHRHNTHDIKAIVWKGNGTLLLDGKTLTLHEGDEFEIPRGKPHQFINASKDPAVILATYTPALTGTDREDL